MLAYIVRKLLAGVITVATVATLIFITMRVVPGDPARAILGEQASLHALEKFRELHGLNDPLFKQWLSFMYSIFSCQFGNTIRGFPVISQFAQVFPYSLELVSAGLLISVIFGVPMGIISALKRGSLIDYSIRVIGLIGISTPSFWLGTLLLLLFSVLLGWFPVGGVGDPNFLSRLRHLVLPAFSLGAIQTAITMRLTRSALLDVLTKDYMNTARSKGLSERLVLYKHALRNCLNAVITVVGMYVAILLGSTILIELIFTRPGLGRLLIDALTTRDYNAIQYSLVMFSIIVILVNLLTDLAYCFLDPRITFD